MAASMKNASVKRLYVWQRAMMLLFVLLALTACGSVESTHTAEETLALAAAGLTGMDRYGFSVRTEVLLSDRRMYEIEAYEGEVVGHTQLKVWPKGGLKQLDTVDVGDARMRNPAGWLARIEKLDKTVEYVQEGSDGKKVRLRIRLAPEAAKQELEAAFRAEFERVADEAKTVGIDAGQAYADSELRRSIAQELDRSRAELDRMLATLEVESDVVVDIERGRLLPIRMEENTMMRYAAASGARTDHRATFVSFAGYDGRP